jgi:hypothetical protein
MRLAGLKTVSKMVKLGIQVSDSVQDFAEANKFKIICAGFYTVTRNGEQCTIEAFNKYHHKSLASNEVESRAKAQPIPEFKNAVWYSPATWPCIVRALSFTRRWFSLLSFVNFRFVIIGLDTDYEWFIAGNPRRQSLWVLSRRPQMSPELWSQALKIASR